MLFRQLAAGFMVGSFELPGRELQKVQAELTFRPLERLLKARPAVVQAGDAEDEIGRRYDAFPPPKRNSPS